VDKALHCLRFVCFFSKGLLGADPDLQAVIGIGTSPKEVQLRLRLMGRYPKALQSRLLHASLGSLQRPVNINLTTSRSLVGAQGMTTCHGPASERDK
jgi:hypothetical protein